MGRLTEVAVTNSRRWEMPATRSAHMPLNTRPTEEPSHDSFEGRDTESKEGVFERLTTMSELSQWVGGLSADDWQAIGAIGTFIVAIAAATFAWIQVKEAARLRREQSRPYVVLYLERTATSIVDLVAKNFGTTAARDIRISWDRAPVIHWGKNAAEPLELFDRLPLLVPGQEWRTVWDVNGRRIQTDEAPFKVKVTSRDASGRRLPEECFDIDTRHFAHEMIREQNGIHEISESLEKIERTISRWSSHADGAPESGKIPGRKPKSLPPSQPPNRADNGPPGPEQ